MVQNGDEDFYGAAVRHWVDGAILEEQGEYDSAVCMQGFAAECALKKILEKGRSNEEIRKYGHFGPGLLRDIEMMLLGDISLAAVIDPACGLRLSSFSLPEILFYQHPDRRYFRDGIYSDEDARECRNAAEDLLKEMFRLRLDGYI